MKGSEGSSPISHLIVEALEGENATSYKQIYNVSLKNGPNPECLVSLKPPLPPLLNIMHLKILWKMEHLLEKNTRSIFHNIFKSIQT